MIADRDEIGVERRRLAALACAVQHRQRVGGMAELRRWARPARLPLPAAPARRRSPARRRRWLRHASGPSRRAAPRSRRESRRRSKALASRPATAAAARRPRSRLASAARTSASLIGTGRRRPQPRRDALETDLARRSATRSPAMISSPFWPSTWERAVLGGRNAVQSDRGLCGWMFIVDLLCRVPKDRVPGHIDQS